VIFRKSASVSGENSDGSENNCRVGSDSCGAIWLFNCLLTLFESKLLGMRSSGHVFLVHISLGGGWLCSSFVALRFLKLLRLSLGLYVLIAVNLDFSVGLSM